MRDTVLGTVERGFRLPTDGFGCAVVLPDGRTVSALADERLAAGTEVEVVQSTEHGVWEVVAAPAP